MRKPLLILLSLLLLVVLFGCSAGETELEDSEPVIKVVTTIYPLADIIRQLGGNKVSVNYLLPAGASPHTYEPTVEQARQVSAAALFVYIGAGLDDWAVKLAETAEPDLHILDLSEQVALLEMASEHHLEDPDTADESRDHGSADPHFWLDPLLVRDSICPAIYKQLVLLSPENEVYFLEELENYRLELTVLHDEIEEATAAFSHDQFIAFHSAWQYFARRYQLKEVAVVAEFPGQEPSASWVAELVRLIEKEKIRAIFAESQFSSALAERIAEESKIEVMLLDPLGGEGLPNRETFIDLIRFNLAVFRQALE